MTPQKGGGDPGGSGAVLGARLVRYAGVQGISLGISNLIQLASLAVVANFLGPADLGQYALLLFLSGVVTQVFVVLSKAGTIRRVFGGGDDDDEDDEDDSQVSASPQRSLGVGILWSLVLGFGGAALMIAFSEPLADWLLGDSGQSIYVVWAAATVAFWPAAKLTSISIWFERRPTAFVIADASRPLIALIALVILLATGAGIEGAIASTAFGVAGATVVGIFLLRRSFHPALDLRETWEIAKQAKRRAPVVFPVLDHPERRRIPSLAGDLGDGARHLHAGLAPRPGRLLPPAGIPHGDAPAPQGGDLPGRLRRVRACDPEGPVPRLLHPALHLRRAGDDPARRGDRRDRAAGVRGRGAADPVCGSGVRHARLLPHGQSELDDPEQPPACSWPAASARW